MTYTLFMYYVYIQGEMWRPTCLPTIFFYLNNDIMHFIMRIMYIMIYDYV